MNRHSSPVAWWTVLRLRGREWLAASVWAPSRLPGTLRRPFASYLSAIAAIALSFALTSLLEHTLSNFTFHGAAGFLALLLIAITWGMGPALSCAAINAVVLSFLVVPPQATATLDPGSQAVGLVMSLCFGAAVGVVASQAEARRRQLVIERTTLAAQQAESSAQRDRLQQILDVMPEGVFICDVAAQIVATNHAAQTLLGRDLAGTPLTGIDFHARSPGGASLPTEMRPTLRALAGEVAQAVQVVNRIPSTGEDIPFLINSAPLRDAGGAIIGAVTVFQDISTIKELERQRERFLTTLSHDLKNPLTGIAGISQILQRHADQLEEPLRGRILGGLEKIYAGTQRMMVQIVEVLDQARVQMRGKVVLRRAPTDLVAFMRKIVDEHQQTTDRHSFRVQATVDSAIGLADMESLQRAVANVLINAIKYSPQGGPITVSLTRSEDPEGAWLRIDIADRGIGIPATDLPHMFELFYRGSNVGTAIAGTGLGLSGAAQAIRAHGGSIAIESIEGMGTTVALRLPLVRESMHTGPETSVDTASGGDMPS